MFGKMFVSAEHKTFGARAIEVGFTVFLMWFGMLLAVSLINVTGLASIDFRTNTPLLGVSANYVWLHSNSITLGQALTEPLAVIGVLGSVLFAPLGEEILFRGFVCDNMASDRKGNLKPQGLFAVLAG